MGKNKNWDREIFTSINWDAIGGCLDRMSDEQVTHILKLAHGWQHDGYQKGLFYEDLEEIEVMCPAGCGKKEERLHYIQCTSPLIAEGNKLIQRKFKESQIRLKTATVICDAFSAILGSLRRRTGQPQLASYFESEMGTMVQDAWKEQEAIGWDNILKGRLNKKWGYAQAKYYQLNPHTSDSKHFT